MQAAWMIKRELRDAELGRIGDVDVVGMFCSDARVILLLVALGLTLVALVFGGIGRWAIMVAAPWAVAHPMVVLGLLAVGIVVLAAVLVRRPWLVEAKRQGLDDAPRRVWRVVGWRRSGRCAYGVAQAIKRGQLDIPLSAFQVYLENGSDRKFDA
jgi:hypothetical protein